MSEEELRAKYDHLILSEDIKRREEDWRTGEVNIREQFVKLRTQKKNSLKYAFLLRQMEHIEEEGASLNRSLRQFKMDSLLKKDYIDTRYNALITNMQVTGKLSIAFTGLARNVESHIRQILDRVVLVACACKEATFLLLESNSQDKSRQIFTEYRNYVCPKFLPRAGELAFNDFLFIPPPKETIVPEESTKDANANSYEDTAYEELRTKKRAERINRLTKLRWAYRRFAADWHAEKKFDVVAVIDFDLVQISKPGVLLRNIHALKTKRFDLVCAHGRGPGDYYYDSFATVLQNLTYVHPLYLRNISTLMPGEVEIWKPRMTIEHFSDMLMSYPDDFYPVKSCFGGLALYNATSFFNKTCSYVDTKFLPDNRFYNRELRVCEHISLHMCICNRNHSCAISTKLETFWDGDQPGEVRRNFTDFIPNDRWSYL
eukprot:TRINITY_DN4623_c0_g2_i1.p1 TRINITY_DN4623_c0_g2~~TRINITY_DN4623_c0_g2_i1.p1  ORF type:complete len:448 (+),score=39.03 TRINITY_DN4623_c0_g2_i1:53-1345(+)